MHFPKKIKEERTKNNMSQQELGEHLNISRQSVSKWERGEGYPNIETLIKLSELFNITIDELLKGDHSLKEKIIEDGKQLAHPKTKLFFDLLLIVGLLLIIAKILLLIANKFFGLDTSFLQSSILYNLIPFASSIVGAIGSEIFGKKYK